MCEISDLFKFKCFYEWYVKLIGEILWEWNIYFFKGLWIYKDVIYKLGGIDYEDFFDYFCSYGVFEVKFWVDVLNVYNSDLVVVDVKL